MKLETEQSGTVVVIRLPGPSLDVTTATAFKEALAPILGQASQVVLDLTALAFVDSSGLGAILSCMRRLAAKGGDLKLCGLSPAVRTVFELVRMHRVVDICNDRQEAVLRFA
jgi:anti-sigma B factor antagonist